MKRNMDLVRQILLQIEATESGKAIKLDMPGYGEEEVGLHVELMIEHGLIEGNVAPSHDDGPAHRILTYRIKRMTWEGQDGFAFVGSCPLSAGSCHPTGRSTTTSSRC